MPVHTTGCGVWLGERGASELGTHGGVPLHTNHALYQGTSVQGLMIFCRCAKMGAMRFCSSTTHLTFSGYGMFRQATLSLRFSYKGVVNGLILMLSIRPTFPAIHAGQERFAGSCNHPPRQPLSTEAGTGASRRRPSRRHQKRERSALAGGSRVHGINRQDKPMSERLKD